MDNLQDLIICPRCQTLHKKRPLQPKEEARCINCNAVLYRYIPHLLSRILALSMTALLCFLIAVNFPLVRIDLAGNYATINLLDAIWQLLDKGYIFIAVFSFLVLFLFPLLLVGSLFLFAVAVMRRKRAFAKILLQFITLLSRWSMLDIFFISILVALIKIYEYAHIYFGFAFWALACFVLLEIYLTRYITIEQYWDMWERL